jgi:hypothetical protein
MLFHKLVAREIQSIQQSHQPRLKPLQLPMHPRPKMKRAVLISQLFLMMRYFYIDANGIF